MAKYKHIFEGRIPRRLVAREFPEVSVPVPAADPRSLTLYRRSADALRRWCASFTYFG